MMTAAELADLASDLGLIEDWLRQDCTARHAEDMADVIHQAWGVIDDLADAAELAGPAPNVTERTVNTEAGGAGPVERAEPPARAGGTPEGAGGTLDGATSTAGQAQHRGA
jgi:hypothetical protein